MGTTKKKVILVRNIIFDKDKTWDGKQIQFFSQDIKKLDKAIKIIKISQEKIVKKIQLKDNLKLKSIPTITCQDHIAKILEENHIIENLDTKKQAKDKKQHWAQS